MKFFLPFLMLALCGCCETQKANVSLEKRQEAVANEIVSIEYGFGDALLQLNNTNIVGFTTKMQPLADRLEKISKELDTLGPFPSDLREFTLKKLDDTEKTLPHIKPLQPEAVKIIPVMQKYVSAWISVTDKAGLLIEAKGELPGINTNGMELPGHP